MTLRKWSLGASRFLACPERGARLMNWHLQLADGSFRDVIYWPENPQGEDFARIRGGNPILFPFSARSYDQGDLGFWRAADGVRRPMPMHGIARQGIFSIDELRPDGFSAVFVPDEDAHAAYPYRYRFTVDYTFAELSLSVHLTLRNLSEEPIPWSAGHHFYFALPWHENATRADYRIEIPAKKAFRATPTGGLTEVKLVAKEQTFDDPELIDRLHTKLKKAEVNFGPRSGEEDITIAFEPGPNGLPPHATLVTWTATGEPPFYCVEPWMGLPNAVEHKQGLHFVAPGQSETFSIAVRL